MHHTGGGKDDTTLLLSSSFIFLNVPASVYHTIARLAPHQAENRRKCLLPLLFRPIIVNDCLLSEISQNGNCLTPCNVMIANYPVRTNKPQQ